jgi:hypothetical protein
MMRPSSSKLSYGRISSGISENTLVERTLEFVRKELPAWRDDSTRSEEQSEERLNAQLCKYLNATSRTKFPMVYFHHEEKQTAERRVDLSALPSEAQFIGATFHSIYEPVVVFEGKRLPTPGGVDRHSEYVTGGSKNTGGIQRFKLGLHGAKVYRAAIIGYIQNGKPKDWFKTINQWIDAASAEDGVNWLVDDRLRNFTSDAFTGVAACSSQHSRKGDVVSSDIALEHFWVEMQNSTLLS